MKPVALFTHLGCVAALAACAHVEPTDGGDAVRVDWSGNVTGCRDVGVIAVSVADKISFYHFSAERIAAKLEMLARNEAARLPADTLVPRTEVTDGAQRFEAYVCTRTELHQRGAAIVPATSMLARVATPAQPRQGS